jgi:two-component system response regulator YesN
MKHIMIVDDQPINRYLSECIFKDTEYSICTAVNSAEALSLALRAPRDLIISDVCMPVMDGSTLCKE